VLFDIDFQGAMKVHAQLPEDSVLIYVLPPSLAEMSRRLHARSQDSEEVIAKRLARAKDEVAAWERFDYVILNDDFDKRLFGPGPHLPRRTPEAGPQPVDRQPGGRPAEGRDLGGRYGAQLQRADEMRSFQLSPT
jgi:hypothetical protein